MKYLGSHLKLSIIAIFSTLYVQGFDAKDVGVRLVNLTRSGWIYVPGSEAWWTNGLDGSDGSDL